MGSLFRKNKGSEKKKARSQHERYLSQVPPPKASDDIDPGASLKAPEVDLAGKLPDGVAEKLTEHLQGGARGLLVDPEDEETRIFAFYEDRLAELGSCPVSRHDDLLRTLNACRNGAVTAGDRRFQIQVFQSLSDFGDRMVVNFMEEGKFDADGLIARRSENIRLINRLKPATSLTRKNVLDIHRSVGRNPRDKNFLDVLLEDQLVSAEQVERARASEDPVLTILQDQIFPRKAAASALARYLGVEYVDAEAVSMDKRAARKLDKEWALKSQVLPYAELDGRLKVAMMDPTDDELVAQVAEKTGCEISTCLSAAQDIMVMIHKAHKVD